MPTHITLLVNPSAGGGRARKLLPEVSGALASQVREVRLNVVESLSFRDARQRAADIVSRASADPEHSDTLLVMGGDGMAHVGINACAHTNVKLGIIPSGTGDDFCRGMGIPRKPMEAVQAIVAGQGRLVDLMSVEGRLTDGDHQRFVGSVVSTGFDAKVNYRVNNSNLPLGSLSYAYAAIAEIAAFRPLHYRLTTNGFTRELEAMMVCVANAGYLGGGMWIAPSADVTDGLLDVTIAHSVDRSVLVRMLPKMYSGSFVSHPAVERFQVSEITVTGENMYAMADGENLGEVPVTMQAHQRCLHLLGRRDTDSSLPPDDQTVQYRSIKS